MSSGNQACPTCAADVPAGVQFCPQCGADVLPARRSGPVVEPTDPMYAERAAPPVERPIQHSSPSGRVKPLTPHERTMAMHPVVTAEGHGPTAAPIPMDSDEAPGFGPGDLVLRQYRIVKKLGTGGMGTVFLGRDDVSGQQVAIKALPAALARDKAIRDRFTQEARALAALDHPNIVPLVTFAADGDDRFLVMKYVEGKNLDDVLGEVGHMSHDKAQYVFEKLVSALGYAHARGVIHRDIKPANVVLSPEGHVTLVDFGIAKQEEGVKLTQTGMLMGTPQYMSPEQISGQGVDGRSDLYAAGLILFEMLTGQPPFTGEKTFAVLRAHVEAQVPDPVQLRGEDIPKPLLGVIDALLQKDPNKRPQTAEDALLLLDKEPAVAPVFGGMVNLDNSGPTNTPITTSLLDDEISAAFGRRRTGLWAALALGVLITGGAGAYTFWPEKPPELPEKPVSSTPEEVERMIERAATLMDNDEHKAALTLLEKGLDPQDALLPEVVAVRIEANIAIGNTRTAKRWLDALDDTPHVRPEVREQAKELREMLDQKSQKRRPKRRSSPAKAEPAKDPPPEKPPEAVAEKPPEPPPAADKPAEPDDKARPKKERRHTTRKTTRTRRDDPPPKEERRITDRSKKGRRFQNANVEADDSTDKKERRNTDRKSSRFTNAQ